MSKAFERITPWIVGAALVVTLSACTGDNPQGPNETPNTASMQPADPPGPGDPPASPGNESTESFTGELSTETITANNMEIEIPTGLRIPEDTLVTKADSTSIMMADQDPAAVIAMVTQSAAEAGYEVYAEPATGTVFVGHGNAVVFSADANFQLITWGPEEMKDALAKG